jgi:hypothetical protein
MRELIQDLASIQLWRSTVEHLLDRALAALRSLVADD